MSDRGLPVALHLLRHADAGDPAAWSGDDANRPLSAKGIDQAERLGRHLAAVGFAPDAVIASPKARAARTAEIVAAALGVNVRLDDRLAGSLGLDILDRLLDDAGRPRTPVLVGHDPEFSELLAALTGAPSLPMQKGGLARLELHDGIRPGGAVLRWLLPPDLVVPLRA